MDNSIASGHAPSMNIAPTQSHHEQYSNGVTSPQPDAPQLNIITTAITEPTPTTGAPGTMSANTPASTFAYPQSATDSNKTALYVGGLDQRVTEAVLTQIFSSVGNVKNSKIIQDKTMQTTGHNYGFVEFESQLVAETALQTLNGRRIFDNEIRVNWAYQTTTSATKEDTSTHHHIFVGDLSSEVNDEVLLQAFSTFGTVSESRVMWDPKTSRSRGYGFVAYADRQEAERALTSMDGEWLGSRAIRCNWANQKGNAVPSLPQMLQAQHMMQMPAAMPHTVPRPILHAMPQTMPHAMPHVMPQMMRPTMPQIMPQHASMATSNHTTPVSAQPTRHSFPTNGTQSYETILQQTPSAQTTVYIGNLSPYTTQTDLIPLFVGLGNVLEARFQTDRGFAFIKMSRHEEAAWAICQLSGHHVNGRPLKCSWGKDRSAPQQDNSPATQQTPQSAHSYTHQPYNFPQYGAQPVMPPQVQPQTAYAQQPYAMHAGMQQPGYMHVQMPQSGAGYGPIPGHYGAYAVQPPQPTPYGPYQRY